MHSTCGERVCVYVKWFILGDEDRILFSIHRVLILDLENIPSSIAEQSFFLLEFKI